MRSRWVIAATVTLALCAAGAFAVAGYRGSGPLASRLGVTVTQVVPQSYATLGEGGDPLVIMIGFPWPHDGYCSGQFTVTATETAEEVRVSEVTSREYRGGGGCAGLGTVDGKASVPLSLETPLGTRTVVRLSDDVALVNTGD